MASSGNLGDKGGSLHHLAKRFLSQNASVSAGSSAVGAGSVYSGVSSVAGASRRVAPSAFGGNVVSIKGASLGLKSTFLSDSELSLLLSNSRLDSSHSDVVLLIHGLQRNPSVESVVSSPEKRRDILSTVVQDLRFLETNNVYTAPRNKHNEEVIRYVDAINRTMLPSGIAGSLANDKVATATIKLRSLQNLLDNSFRDKVEEEKKKAVSKGSSVGSVSWRKSFADFKRASFGGVTSYVAR